MTDAFAIETTDLRKHYGAVEALRGLTLQVPTGSIFGFLGRNGAGKTTTIKVLLGIARATSGSARVLGTEAGDTAAGVALRRRIGFVSEEKELYDYMTVDEIIRFTASFYPRWRRDLEDRYRRRFELPGTRRVKALSRGMRTKLAILLALSRGADLLVLDEPTSGLDPAVTEDVLQALVSQVADERTTVFFSSHQLADVEQVADRVAIVHRGAVVVSGELDELRERYCRVQLVFDGDAPPHDFGSDGIVRVRREGRVITVVSSAGAEPVRRQAEALGATSVTATPVSLKDIFLETANSED
jgi:ABC-2 type transport system ATP-binding protein